MIDCNKRFVIIILILFLLLFIIINRKMINCNNICNNTYSEGFVSDNSTYKSLEKWTTDNDIKYILDRKLCEFYINSSHNSFLEGYQVMGESRISNLKNALDAGARCIELDIHEGVGSPLVMHTGSLPGFLSDYLKIIKDEGFKNTNDPLILYLEIFNSGNESHMKNIGSLVQSYLGDRLYEWKMSNWNGDNTKYCLNVPIKKLLGKIIIIINYYNMNTSDGKGLIYRDKYLFPISHATANEPENGWYPELGPLINNVGADDSIKRKPNNQLIRVYPNNTLTSSNYDPNPFWSNNYNIVALNFGNDDDNMKKNKKKFKYGGFMPFDIFISDNGTVNKPIQDVFIWDSERKAPLYSNINVNSNIIMPNKCYCNDCTWWSNDNKYYLRMQTDGNLVLYNINNKALWSSKTSGNPNTILHMQKDGNLVIYNGSGSKALWSSGTFGNTWAYAGLTDGNSISNADFNIYDYKGKKIKKLY